MLALNFVGFIQDEYGRVSCSVRLLPAGTEVTQSARQAADNKPYVLSVECTLDGRRWLLHAHKGWLSTGQKADQLAKMGAFSAKEKDAKRRTKDQKGETPSGRDGSLFT